MDIKNFYNEKRRFTSGKSQLEVKFKEYTDTFSLKLLNYKDGLPDAEIGHFGYNFYFRLPYGMKKGKYSSFKTLKESILKTSAKNNLTFEYLKAEIKAGNRYFNSKDIIL